MASLVSGTTSDMTPRPSRRAFYTGDRFQAAAFIVPSCIFLALLTIWPFFYSVYLSLHRVRLTALKRAVFVGFENYLANYDGEWAGVLADPVWWRAVYNTLWFTVISVVLETIFGFVVALVLNAHFPGRAFVRAAVLVPSHTAAM